MYTLTLCLVEGGGECMEVTVRPQGLPSSYKY